MDLCNIHNARNEQYDSYGEEFMGLISPFVS